MLLGIILITVTGIASGAATWFFANKATEEVIDAYEDIVSKYQEQLDRVTNDYHDLASAYTHLEAELTAGRINAGPDNFLTMPARKEYKASRITYGEF